MALTSKQERFVQELVKGKSQRQAYLSAGYSNQKGNMDLVDVQASKLFADAKVLQRYNNLVGKHEKKALWTREIATQKILSLLSKAEDDYYFCRDEGLINSKDFGNLMLKAAGELNKMNGYNQQNISMDADVKVKTAEETLKGIQGEEF